MAKYGSGGDVPTAAGDPNPVFFGSSGANCYAYAINVYRSTNESINPGEIRAVGKAEVAGGGDDDKTYQTACESDGLIYVGKDPSAYTGQTGGYLVAFFKSTVDMHWRRCDSEG